MTQKDYGSNDDWRAQLPKGRFVVSDLNAEVAHQSAMRDELAYLDEEPGAAADASETRSANGRKTNATQRG